MLDDLTQPQMLHLEEKYDKLIIINFIIHFFLITNISKTIRLINIKL